MSAATPRPPTPHGSATGAPAATSSAPPRRGPREDGRRFGLRAVLGLAALLVGGVPFLVLWLLMRQSWARLADLDAGLADELNTVVSRSPALTTTLRWVTDLGGTGFAVLALVLTAAFLLIRGRRRLAAFVATAGLGLPVLINGTKALIDRTRHEQRA